MKKIINKQAFTIIELIVVMVIVTILGIITFISYIGYTSGARDAKRIADISDLETSLGLYYMNNSNYPLPDNGFEVSYHGEALWIQGTIGDTVTTNLSKNLTKKPLDPLTDVEYVYSVINTQLEYEILSLYESDIIFESSLNLINKSNAIDKFYPKINGIYNGIFIKTSNYIVGTPSIINSEITNSSLVLNNESIKSQIITGGNNLLPIGILPSQTGGLNINLSIYTGSINRYTNNIEKEKIALALQNTYKGSILEENDFYNNILDKNGAIELITFVNEVVFKDVSVETEIEFNCVEEPNYSNVTFIYGSPTLQKENWQNTNSGNPCYFECNIHYTWNSSTETCDADTQVVSCSGSIPSNATETTSTGYTQIWNGTIWAPTTSWGEDQVTCDFDCDANYTWDGTNCEIAPNLYASCTGVNTPTPFSATTTYLKGTPNECSTADIIVCSGNGDGYIISACNIGTTTAGTDWNISGGNFFQWGNNAGMTSSIPTSSSQVDASSYGPGNYYNNSIFIKLSSNWSSVQNDNLWGDITNTNEARQGPCASGYHVPTNAEWVGIHTAGGWGSDGESMQIALKLPYTGFFDRGDAMMFEEGSSAYYWSSSFYGNNAYFLNFSIGSIHPSWDYNRAHGLYVRCFKN